MVKGCPNRLFLVASLAVEESLQEHRHLVAAVIVLLGMLPLLVQLVRGRARRRAARAPRPPGPRMLREIERRAPREVVIRDAGDLPSGVYPREGGKAEEEDGA